MPPVMGHVLVSRYFARGVFTLPALAKGASGYRGTLSFMVDDGIVLTVNGVEVARINVGNVAFSA